MKLYVAICLFGAFAATLALPQDRPQVGPPMVRPPRPEFARTLLFARRPHGPPPPMHQGHRPEHPISHEISPELHNLMRDMRDFLDLVPRREIRNLIKDHIQDPELRATMYFFRTPEFHAIVAAIAETAEFKAIGKYFASANWPWIQSTIDEAIRSFDATAMKTVSKRSTGGLSGLLDAVIAVLPKEQLRALFEEKMQNNSTFRSVMEIMSSPELKALMSAAHESTAIRTQFNLLAEHGIDMEKIVSLQFALVGY